MVDLPTATIIDTVEAKVPAPPRRQRQREWIESAETSTAFEIACTAREDAQRLLLRPPPG